MKGGNNMWKELTKEIVYNHLSPGMCEYQLREMCDADIMQRISFAKEVVVNCGNNVDELESALIHSLTMVRQLQETIPEVYRFIEYLRDVEGLVTN